MQSHDPASRVCAYAKYLTRAWTDELYVGTVQQVNRLAISPDKRLIAAAGNQSIKLYDITAQAQPGGNIPPVSFPIVLESVPRLVYCCLRWLHWRATPPM